MIKNAKRWFSVLCASTLVLSLFQPNASAQPIISVSGSGGGWVALFSGQAYATSWTQTNTAMDVGVLVQLSSFGEPDQTGRAYLTSALGPGTTTAQEIASASFAFPLAGTDVVLFSGLTLGPGTYYLSLVGDSGTSGSGWLTACPSSVVAADGALLGLNYGFLGFAPYLPASPVWSQPSIFTRFSVASVLNGATLSSGLIHTNDTFLAQPGEPVTATNQTAKVFVDTPQLLSLDARDPEGGLMSFWLESLPEHGTLSIRGVGPLTAGTCYGVTRLLYAPAPGFVGTDGFSYVVADAGSSAQATVTVNVVPASGPPTAFPQTVTTGFGAPAIINLSGSDPDGDPIVFTVTVGPAHGALSGVGATRVYTPAVGFSGLDTFSFVVSDGRADSQPAVVTVNVLQPPSAFPQTVATEFGVPVTINLSGSDPDEDPIVFTVKVGPAHGALSGVGATQVYTPAVGFSGLDTFSFVVSDGRADSQPAVVTVNVLQPRSAFPQTVATEFGVPVTINLSGSDPDGDPIVFTVTVGPTHGTLSGVGATQLYTPAAGFSGLDTFSFVVNDGHADSQPAVVTVNVLQPLSAFPQTVTTEFGVPVPITLCGSDPDGDPIGFTVTVGPAQGALSGVGATRVYTPAVGFSGVDTFSFVVNDGHADSQPAVVSVTVAGQNAPPIAPVNLVANRRVGHQILLSWTDRSSVEKGFRIERAAASGVFRQIATVAANVQSFVDRKVQPGKTYSYRVLAYNTGGSSTYSNIATARAIRRAPWTR